MHVLDRKIKLLGPKLRHITVMTQRINSGTVSYVCLPSKK